MEPHETSEFTLTGDGPLSKHGGGGPALLSNAKEVCGLLCLLPLSCCRRLKIPKKWNVQEIDRIRNDNIHRYFYAEPDYMYLYIPLLYVGILLTSRCCWEQGKSACSIFSPGAASLCSLWCIDRARHRTNELFVVWALCLPSFGFILCR